MKDDDLTSNNKQGAYVCRMDAEEQHREYYKLYSKDAKKVANDLRALVHTAYNATNYLTARKTFISVKVEDRNEADLIRNKKQIQAVTKFCDKHKIREKTFNTRKGTINLCFEVKEAV